MPVSTRSPATVPVYAHPLCPERGFLPSEDPLRRLPAAYDEWEEVAHELPKLLVARQVRARLDALPVLSTEAINTEAELERAMLLLSFFGHAYVWGDIPPVRALPEGIAVPWHHVATRLGRPPVLSYQSYVLTNWRRLDPEGPIALGNIVTLQNFAGGIDEEWFILVHVHLEAVAGRALAAIGPAQKAVVEDNTAALVTHLEAIAAGLEAMTETLGRMPERCDPYIYYHRVRPYVNGWKNNPAVPDGIVYEGVADYGGTPQQFRGGSGAQTAIIPAIDAALGIDHADDPLRPYLLEMRAYMTPAQRAFIEAVEVGPSVRDYVLAHHRAYPKLREAYNTCVVALQRFRQRHLEYAALYVQRQAQRQAGNSTEIGTGGTPFMPFLKKHRDETRRHLIGEP
ncbi:MAG: indoleamine 2,3-dioxygenase [Ardenticatenia bacterium]|nr:indoleamine 2,3-dioxygenase [Ardenticatenia bacterium]